MNASSNILLFAAQGSTPAQTAELLYQVRSRDAAAKELIDSFLEQGFRAWKAEISCLSTEDSLLLDDSVREHIDDPEKLMLPPRSCQANAVVQSVSFYVQQLLSLILHIQDSCSGDAELTAVETSGLCSGMIPAVLAATGPKPTTQFLHLAIDGLRLAFWIGARASMPHSENDSMAPQGPRAGFGSILTVRGYRGTEIEKKLEIYNSSLPATSKSLRISTIISEDIFSVTGPPDSLERFKRQLPAGVSGQYPPVNGFYHGGETMQKVVQQVVDDVRTREIRFPSWGDLRIQLRSTANGYILVQGHQSLLETVLSHILVDVADWKTTWDYIDENVNSINNAPYPTRIVLIGPNTNSLRRTWLSSPPKSGTQVACQPDGHQVVASSMDHIAVVGMSLNFPSGDNVVDFWDSIANGYSTMSQIPTSRFDASRCQGYSESGLQHERNRGTPVQHGNFLENPFDFDNSFFNISPREAKSMDPQQRLLLHAAWKALENAGCVPGATSSTAKDKFGVYIGVATGDYTDNLRGSVPDVYYSPGTLRAFLSGRISYAFGLKGPSIVVDTACSSSIVALHQACKALQSGDCTAAMVGGVNTISSPDMYLGLARAHFLSPTGQCKPFDEAADGYCRAEGCGVIVLKKLTDALEEGDRILGVIHGTAVNQCGDAKSITHPDHTTQASLINTLLQTSRHSPCDIDVVEAHGTGTQAGDNAEITGLRSVFGGERPSDRPLYISSVKGNIGHAEAASGMAALGKLIIMMAKKQIPPQASLTTLNPSLGLEDYQNMVVPRELLPWVSYRGAHRLALLNNFGAAGSNAALILGEPPRQNSARPNDSDRSCHFLNIAAESDASLETVKRNLTSLIDSEMHNGLKISDFCYSANARKIHSNHFRCSVSGRTLAELREGLRSAQISAATTAEPNRSSGPRKSVFVFSGQGSTHLGMGAELISTSPVFDTIVRNCDKMLSRDGFEKVSPYLLGDDEWYSSLDACQKIIVSQCACFVLEYALAQMWMSWNVRPDLLIGHSLGEYACFAVAGIVSLHDALLMVARRANIMTRNIEPGLSAMMACRLSSSSTKLILDKHRDVLPGLNIACDNGPESTVVAGRKLVLEAFAEICASTGTKTTLLDVPFAHHSQEMDAILSEFTDSLEKLQIHMPKVPVGSSLNGRVLAPDEALEPTYFAKQTRHTVSFSKLTQSVAATFAETSINLLEIGPSANTIPCMEPAFNRDQSSWLASLKPNESAWVTISATLQTLYHQRQPVKWTEVYSDSEAKLIELPPYPLVGKTFVVPYEESLVQRDAATGRSSVRAELDILPFFFLDRKFQSGDFENDGFTVKFEAIKPFMQAHRVGARKTALCPASVYMEIALEAAECLSSSPDSLSRPQSTAQFHIMQEIEFGAPLVETKSHVPQVKALIAREESRTTGRYIFSCSDSHGGPPFCRGKVAVDASGGNIASSARRKAAYVSRQPKHVFHPPAGPQHMEAFSSRTIYDAIFPRVVQYSEPLKTITRLTISHSGLEGHALFRLPPHISQMNPRGSSGLVSHPALIDTMLHAAGFIANASVDVNTACICATVDNIVLPANMDSTESEQFQVYCTLVDVGSDVIAASYVSDMAGELLAWAEGMSFKKLVLKSFEAHLSRLQDRGLPKPSDKGNLELSHALPRTRIQSRTVRPQVPRGTVDDVKIHQQTFNYRDLYSVIREVCGLDQGTDIGQNSRLSELGIDSLLLTELGDTLSTRFSVISGPGLDLDGCVSVQDLFAVVEASIRAIDISISQPPGTPPSRLPSPATTDETKISLGSDLESLLIEMLGLDYLNIEDNRSLGSLGLDSLTSIEFLDRLQQRFGLDIAGYEQLPELTFRQLERALEKQVLADAVQRPVSETTSTLFPATDNHLPAGGLRHLNRDSVLESRQPNNAAAFPTLIGKHCPSMKPFYLFHDGSGKCGWYAQLALPANYNFYGVNSLDFAAPDPDVQTLEELASLYITKAGLERQDQIMLGGWSFGGVLALEVARQLRRSSKTAVRGLILLDAPAPVDHEPLPNAIIEYISKIGPPGRLRTSNPQLRTRLAAQFSRHARLLQEYHPRGDDQQQQVENGTTSCALIHCTQPFDSESLCSVRYPWLSDAQHRSGSIESWKEYLGPGVVVIELACDHFSVMDPEKAEAVSQALREACEALERNERI